MKISVTNPGRTTWSRPERREEPGAPHTVQAFSTVFRMTQLKPMAEYSHDLGINTHRLDSLHVGGILKMDGKH